ncbi:hypothetical protein ACFO5R_21995 [Halosolutus amylolyticus]|uniref:Uncharacterized protein n=1 Tax=Halosolutus amylolyticus TaxID=2932267 RepID=A0ABD5PVQ7_9EURY|nr:hypothetical protein [Halosolutus amylolyticus]
MSSAHPPESGLVAYAIVLGLGLLTIGVGSLVGALLFGIPVTVVIQLLGGVASLVVSLLFLYLFYRLVLAMERIARKL